jgi:putative peptidoglycan lipid II flippase
MIRSFLTVSTGTLASRLLGFVRDSMIAALLGAAPVADAFLFAFQFVNVVRRSMSEGGLNAALIPAWLRVRDASGAAAAAAFAGRVLGTISLALMMLIALIGLGLPPLVAAFAPGLTDDPSLQLAIDNTRLMLPYLAFAGPATVMMALLNAQGRFVLTAFLPLVFNIALIVVMIVLLVQRQDAGLATRVLAITVGIAGLLQMAVVIIRRGGGLATPVRASFDAQMRRFFGKAIPGMIASSAPQLLVIAGAIIASSSPSAVSWLYFANRLVELPLGIVGVAMGTVLIPQLTRALRSGDTTGVAHAESRGLELAAGLALPATLGLIVLSEPVVRILFEHGAFSSADTTSTAQALMWLALGMPANVLVKALSPAFFAREDTLAPLLATLKGVAFALVLAVLLGHWFGASGVAAAISLGAWSTALTLIRRGAESFGFSIDAAAQRRLPGILAAALVMGAALWLATRFAPALAQGAHGLLQAVILFILIIAGIVIYGLFLRLFGVAGWRQAVDALRVNKAADLRD